ncbi:unnamed protein product [Rotaria sordida]|uniref:Uncharacterized protein n=1 Tax=Rotaria sordida TaxID=392033 RepID=A0A815JX06_9BILA|nr:unnamed protein product [Rotaria sordida]CAF1387942.1 unnamed protein product [Rotaria sordida]
MRRKPVKNIIAESFVSDISDDIDPNETSSEPHRSYTDFDDNVSSSSSTNTEKTTLRQETFVRFISAKSKNGNVNRQSCSNDMFSDSDESYPLYESICNSTSSDFEDLSIQDEIIDQETLIDTQKMQDQQNTITNDNSNEPDKTSSISSDIEKMTMHEESTIKFVSSHLIRMSDIQQKKITYETSSDLTKVEV